MAASPMNMAMNIESKGVELLTALKFLWCRVTAFPLASPIIILTALLTSYVHMVCNQKRILSVSLVTATAFFIIFCMTLSIMNIANRVTFSNFK